MSQNQHSQLPLEQTPFIPLSVCIEKRAKMVQMICHKSDHIIVTSNKTALAQHLIRVLHIVAAFTLVLIKNHGYTLVLNMAQNIGIISTGIELSLRERSEYDNSILLPNENHTIYTN